MQEIIKKLLMFKSLTVYTVYLKKKMRLNSYQVEKLNLMTKIIQVQT